ncbi:2-amino-4-hydroxy-6-hydroxymethyldihydropteridine diphosphokinase [Carboxylicivirga taeanensis]|uniref:2-amino-4-hydroxy-6- hydroxymethyldihydropteridine diphosphokinase n=1 Tax=Carboxylicivirga taeanensis TaxID=1416875 RepID=UPI003F6E07AD
MEKSVYAVIGVGSNINAQENISLALKELRQHVEILKVSEWLQTKPIGITDQADFFNGAVLVKVQAPFDILNRQLKQIEDKLGRDRSRPKYGPREIDLDIIVFDNEVRDDDFYTRDFLQALVKQVWTKK